MKTTMTSLLLVLSLSGCFPSHEVVGLAKEVVSLGEDVVVLAIVVGPTLVEVAGIIAVDLVRDTAHSIVRCYDQHHQVIFESELDLPASTRAVRCADAQTRFDALLLAAMQCDGACDAETLALHQTADEIRACRQVFRAALSAFWPVEAEIVEDHLDVVEGQRVQIRRRLPVGDFFDGCKAVLLQDLAGANREVFDVEDRLRHLVSRLRCREGAVKIFVRLVETCPRNGTCGPFSRGL